MAQTLTYSDSITTLTIHSQHEYNAEHPAFRAFSAALYALHTFAILGSYVVSIIGANEYHVVLTLKDGRQFPQDIKKFGPNWKFRQAALSDYFELKEVILNNGVRGALQDFIDSRNVTDMTIVFV